MTPDLQNAYRTLEVSPGAAPEEIRRAYILLVNVWHPDRFAHEPRLRTRAEERLKALNRAYAIIHDAPVRDEPAPGGGMAERGARGDRSAREWYEEGRRLTEVTMRLRGGPDASVSNVPNLAQHFEGMRALREAVRLDPRLSAAWHALGSAHLQLGEHEQALVPLNEAAALAPENAAVWTDLGTANAQLQRHQQTARAFGEVVRLEPQNPSAWHALGEALVRLLRWPEAARAIREAVRLNPGLGESWLLLGRTLAFPGPDAPVAPEEALEAFREAVRIRPDLVEAWQGLGATLAGLGHYREATDALRRAVDLEPASADAWYGLAVVASVDRSPAGTRTFREAHARLDRLDPKKASQARDLLAWRRRLWLRIASVCGRTLRPRADAISA
jgi:cytochrome c-type biogenesis protein CcmH/NrfG